MFMYMIKTSFVEQPFIWKLTALQYYIDVADNLWLYCCPLFTHLPLSVCPVLSPVVEGFASYQLLQHPGPKLGPLFILELLEAQSQMELRRVAAQERIVLPLFPNSRWTLKMKFMSNWQSAVRRTSLWFIYTILSFGILDNKWFLSSSPAWTHLCMSFPIQLLQNDDIIRNYIFKHIFRI